ncbi:MAG: OmpA family protein [Phycisphaerales bacterium]|nr:OmpA family protein [Phycisphaerales bacterium]
MLRRAMVAVMGLGGLVVSLGLGGCSSVPKKDYDLAVQENTELRDRLASMQDALRDRDARISELESDPGRGQVTGSTGFEGISGVNVSLAGGNVIVGVAGDVLFDSGKVDLKTTAKSSLDRVAQVIRTQYPGSIVRIEGYTDSDPIRKSNWKSNEHLSAERALAVEKYLVSKGLDNNTTYSAAFGPAHSKGSKKDSRRVEIVVLASGQ